MKYLNIAFYHFFKVTGKLEDLRVQIKELCLELGLKGTLIIAKEGVNLMVAGEVQNVRKFIAFWKDFIGEPNLFFKESASSHIPFNRMLVKAKDQLIPVDDPSIAPKKETAPRMSPKVLKQWLDEKKDFVLFDTRNRFEYRIGSFETAMRAEIDNFRDFEKTLGQLPTDWKGKPVVTFCTGGIRCEKASPLMMKHGFKEVYQLDGGILNYFKEVGGEHYKGDCFVFDRRVALNPKLEESDVVECFNCRHPVTAEEQKLDTYQYEVSCPYCYGKEDKTKCTKI